MELMASTGLGSCIVLAIITGYIFALIGKGDTK
ncbi:hypothetical protein JOF28_001957 [Leucobacter exalbidus]|uniref:Uncharacterized protein n=1 Tax=Leucobacter exalbidus TaxID=662960 RepID=A0A940PPC7_9MICO|nr:hypothetical protein [Leucobacter exalbidus]